MNEGYPRWAIILLFTAQVCGCGTYSPDIAESWEPVIVSEKMETSIKGKIICELVRSIDYVNNRFETDSKSARPIPDDWGVQLQISLTVEESSAASPGATLTRILPSAEILGNKIAQSVNLSAGANLSATATRTDTFYSYYNVGKILKNIKPGGYCNDPDKPLKIIGTSPLLQSDIGIRKFLVGAVQATDAFPSSSVPKEKSNFRFEVYSYETKFVLLSNANINPVFRLANISSNTSSNPLLNFGRTRTHDVVITFAPSTYSFRNGLSGPAQPPEAALQTHFNSQLVQALDRLRQPF